MTLLAHGLGGRSDLPIPLWMAIYGAGAAVVISFFALGALWQDPKLKGAEAGRHIPAFERVVTSMLLRSLLRLLSVCALAIMIALAFYGPPNEATNPVPTWFYVWFWVGLVPASVFFGPVWRVLNPLRAITRLLAAVVGDAKEEAVRPLPPSWGYWPATVALLSFLWLELVYDESARTVVVGIYIVTYSVVQIAMGLRYGSRWFRLGDGFEAYSTLLSNLAPVGRRSDGRLVLRNPFDGLASIRTEPGLNAFVFLILGSTAFDGITRTRAWTSVTASSGRGAYLLTGTAGLVGSVALVGAIFLIATRISGTSRSGLFVHSLVPIALGYTVAHYFSLFVFQGQAGYILADDPLGHGWSLFGLADASINYRAISTSQIAWVQVLAIVAGHIAGVVSAHDRAMSVFPLELRTKGQYPLLSAMVVFTTGGIFLLVGT